MEKQGGGGGGEVERRRTRRRRKGNIFRTKFKIISATRSLCGKLRGSSALQRWLAAPHSAFIWSSACSEQKVQICSIQSWEKPLPSAFWCNDWSHWSPFASYSFQSDPQCTSSSPWTMEKKKKLHRHECRDTFVPQKPVQWRHTSDILLTLTEFSFAVKPNMRSKDVSE